MKLPFISQKKQHSSKSEKDLQRNKENEVSANTDFSEEQSVLGLSELYSPVQTSESHTHDVIDVLLEMGKIDKKQHASLRKKQKANPSSDVSSLFSKTDKISTDDILTAQARIYDLEFKHIESDDVQKEAFSKLDIDYIKSNRIMPVEVHGKKLIVATSRPADLFVIEDVKSQTQMNVEAFVCTDEDIDKVCSSFSDKPNDYNIDDIMGDMAEVEVVQDQLDDSEDLELMAGQSPVIKFVNYLISNAVREGASDIHIEPKEKVMKTRYRIDGVTLEDASGDRFTYQNHGQPRYFGKKAPAGRQNQSQHRRKRNRPAYLDTADEPRRKGGYSCSRQ
jgi:type IV pilus assembly protein PilB